MINRPGLIRYLGIGLAVAFFLIGCSSGGGDSASGGGGGGGTTANTANITPVTVELPGALGSLEDIGDLVGAGDHWYDSKIKAIGVDGSVVGQTSYSSPTKAAFLWDAVSETNTYLGHRNEIYDPTANPVHPFIYSEAVGIGPDGDVICNSTTGFGWPEDTEKRAFYYDHGAVVLLDPVNDGVFSEAHSLNRDYVLFTAEFDKSAKRRAGRYYKKSDSSFGWLGGIVGATNTEPVAINFYNQAVINSEGTTAVFHDLDVDVVQTLNHLPGASTTTAAAINDSAPTGHIVGTSGTMAFFWDGGSMYPCGTLGGSTSDATDLNIHDQVVGFSTTATGATHAFVWVLDAGGVGSMTDLGTLGGTNSWATAINDNGLIVGYAETGEIYSQGGVTQPIVHACAWYGNVIYDLGIHNDFYTYPFVEPYPFSEAIDVNDNNRIAGNSYTLNQHYRGFVLDPDPSLVP